MDTPSSASGPRPAACPMCCRAFTTPLELPPVVIVDIADIAPKNYMRHVANSIMESGIYCDEDPVIERLSEPDQQKIRALAAVYPENEPPNEIDVSLASGEAAVLEIKMKGFYGSWWMYLDADFLPCIAPHIANAKQYNPFRDSFPNAISVRDVWASLPLKTAPLGFVDCEWLRILPDGEHYLGIGGMCFSTPGSGSFELSLYTNGPNRGSAGGPTVELVAKLLRVDFMLASHFIDLRRFV
jgi:hypothetical protein